MNISDEQIREIAEKWECAYQSNDCYAFEKCIREALKLQQNKIAGKVIHE